MTTTEIMFPIPSMNNPNLTQIQKFGFFPTSTPYDADGTLQHDGRRPTVVRVQCRQHVSGAHWRPSSPVCFRRQLKLTLFQTSFPFSF